jgi:hypothetical protein
LNRSGAASCRLVFNISRFGSGLLTVRLRHDELESSLAHLKQTWDGLEPAYPFQYAFVDDVLARQYEAEKRLAQVFRVCAGLTIFVVCLGCSVWPLS